MQIRLYQTFVLRCMIFTIKDSLLRASFGSFLFGPGLTLMPPWESNRTRKKKI